MTDATATTTGKVVDSPVAAGGAIMKPETAIGSPANDSDR